ncbi:unnamed protein product, partial [Polarella glacialis]
MGAAPTNHCKPALAKLCATVHGHSSCQQQTQQQQEQQITASLLWQAGCGKAGCGKLLYMVPKLHHTLQYGWSKLLRQIPVHGAQVASAAGCGKATSKGKDNFTGSCHLSCDLHLHHGSRLRPRLHHGSRLHFHRADHLCLTQTPTPTPTLAPTPTPTTTAAAAFSLGEGVGESVYSGAGEGVGVGAGVGVGVGVGMGVGVGVGVVVGVG